MRQLLAKAQGHKDFVEKTSKPCHVGIHRIALAEYSQMSTCVPGVQSYFKVFCIILFFVLAKLATSSIRVNCCWLAVCVYLQAGTAGQLCCVNTGTSLALITQTN